VTETEEFLQKLYREAEQRLDYFTLGVVGALFVYTAQSTPFEQLMGLARALTIGSLVTLLGAGIFGFLRLEQIILGIRANIEKVRGREIDLEPFATRAHRHYLWRNWLLLASFVLIGLSKAAP
jgi:hypothetical protein